MSELAPQNSGGRAMRIHVTAADWRTFAGLFSGSRRLLLASIALSLVQSALLVPVALVVRHVFDRVLPRGDGGDVALFGALLLALYVASAGVSLLNRYLVLRATKAAVTRLRGLVFERLLGFPRARTDRGDLGTLHATVVQDTERLDTMAISLVALLVPAALVAAALSVALAVVDALLFALLAAVVPALLLVSARLGRLARARTRAWQEAFSAFSADTLSALRALGLTKAHGLEQVTLARQRARFEELGHAGRTMSWLHAAYALVNSTVAAVGGVLVLVAGGVLVTRGRMTVGDLLAFYALVALLRSQVNTMLHAAPGVISGRESLARLAQLLESGEPEPYAGTRRIDFTGAVDVERVGFAYRGGEPVLRDVSIRLRPREVVALVGPNGAGKTTLARIVLGLHRPSSGRVLADGVPFDELDLPRLRHRVAVVEEAPYLFPDTVAANIAALTAGASDGDIVAAAELVGAGSFIAELPDGFETHIGDEGALLSGGQRQRIAIARALLRRPALLVLDEPTTSLDEEATARLLESLRALPGRPAILVVTHSPVVSRAADRVYVLRDGGVEEAPGSRRLVSAVEER